MSEVTLAQQLEQELQINGATSVSNGAQRRSSGSGSSSDDHSARSHEAAGGNGSPATGSSVSAASLTSSPSQSEQPSPSESPASSTASARSPATSSSAKNKRKKFRSRTQSEGAAWTRASFRMQKPVDNASSSELTRNSEGSLPRLVEVLLENVEYGGASDSDDPTTRTRVPRKLSGGLTLANLVDAMEKMQRVQRMSREGCISMWLEQGEISERASEILEDARLSLHGKEKNLYNSSARRLSEAQDPMLNSLGEKLVASARNSVTLLDAPKPEPEEPLPTRMSKEELPPRHTSNSSTTVKAAPSAATAATKKSTTAPKPEAPTRQSVPPPAPAPAATRSSLLPASVTESITTSSSTPDQPASLNDPLRQSDFFRPESATLYHEAVRWEGVLSRRSEWLRRLEKHYYVLEGKYLRRFASKEAYIASRDEPLLQENERSARRPSSASSNPVSHLYILAGVKESASRVNGFTFITEDKKTLQLTAPTPVERVIWMRLGLEAIVAIPNLPVAPLDMEEFYAMLVVLYTAHSGKWRTEGDMAVTLPPPSEQVFTRFFRLLDRDIIFCSNYPPSVPFHGAFRGHAGVVSFIHEFSKNTAWTNFKIAGLSVEGSIAVASGKEELENKRDNRRFIQNWVHKFMFYSDGRLARFEINGDVVAASAVFKVPGAATTLKLPQEFNEVDAEHGKLGTLLVHVMHGSGLKMGVNAKKAIKEAVVVAGLHHAQQTVQQQNAKDAAAAASATSTNTTTIGGISMPTLTRKFSSGISLLSGVATGNATGPPSTGEKDSDAGKNSFSTGAPRNSSQASFSPMNPVWNKVIELPFHDLIGTCTLNMEVVDQGGSPSVKVGLASLNVAKYIMSSHAGGSDEEDAAMASDARWYTVSNAKGEYCGKIMVGITCRRGSSNDADALAKPRLRKSRSVVIDRQNPPTAQMMQWDAPLTTELMGGAMTPASSYSGRGAQTPGGRMGDDQYSSHTQEYRRHGWANVKLSPESAVRPRSDGAASDKSAKKREATAASKPSNNGRFDSVICKENEDMHTFMVCGAPFTIPRNYSLIKVCGRGAYGIVIAATNTNTGGNVAIKKVIDCIWHPHQLKQILRESRLMRHLDHENLLSLMDLIPPPSYSEFRDVYMTVDLMEMDLHRIIYSKEVLLDDHIRYFLYQILSGLNHMHKAGVLHRDLKPSNLLINSDCQLKICDLGLARSKDLDDNGMTEYVVTRWYRAPELLLGSAYGDGVDLWAAGCIFAEMLGRKPLFPGETYVHQLQLIMNVLGVPEEHSFKENPQANKLKGRQLLSRTQAGGGIDVSSMFPNANPEGLDLLWKMLVFDVEKRISVEEALRHPYLAAYYDDEKENRPVEKFKSFDLEGLDETELKELMFKEICQFHPEEMEKRAKVQAENPEAVEKLPPGWVKRESRSVPGKFYYSNPKRGISTWIKEEMD